MLRIKRTDLPSEAIDYLKNLTEYVVAADDPKSAANDKWRNKNKNEFTIVRENLRRMCSGLERCMYCEDNMGTDIEHFRPKSVYPEHAFSWSNYLLACSHCNSNEKRSQFPLDSDRVPLALNPADEDPELHLALLPSGEYTFRTEKGAASVELFGLNRSVLIAARRAAWSGFSALARDIWNAHESAHPREVETLARAIDLPHGSVLMTMIGYAELGTPIMDGDLTRALRYLAVHLPQRNRPASLQQG